MNRRPPSAWRQPLVWLVFSLPAMSIVAGFALLALAQGPVDSVADPVQRTAQVQDADLSPDLEARRMGLSARIHRVGFVLDVIPMGAGFDRAARLDLVLRHPVAAAQDRRVALSPSVAGWSGRIDGFDDEHDWVLELAPPDRRWRLRGRWQAHAAQAEVGPALGGR
ncbi:FixH family protein [Lysobacter dokdonensis DS-58]|uniref:FixH family protein n=1 Tax=Lysobacter dokdonensis DS-58 TaxID=1300345 RepID=A0A0A2X464_9GAMM|nr:FixH family protein [Lysobacter dokdonensis]KGQ20034.1 FixH family protein [Lysobacter dokdonensis DS-58]